MKDLAKPFPLFPPAFRTTPVVAFLRMHDVFIVVVGFHKGKKKFVRLLILCTSLVGKPCGLPIAAACAAASHFTYGIMPFHGINGRFTVDLFLLVEKLLIAFPVFLFYDVQHVLNFRFRFLVVDAFLHVFFS